MPGTLPYDDADTRLARRYPPPRTPRTVALGLGAVAAALGIGLVVWLGVDHATVPVSGRINTWTINSASSAEFTLTVDRTDPQQAAMCRVIAQADNFERVGELAVEVPPGEQRLTEVAATIETFRQATSISLDSCQPAN